MPRHLSGMYELPVMKMPSLNLNLLKITFRESQLPFRKLCNVPFGQTVSYGEIAVLLGGKEKARAVGAAVATNPVAILIPCHRALPTNGKIQMGRGSEEKLARLGNCKQ